MEFKELVTKSEAELNKELARLRQELAELSVKARLQQVKGTHQLGVIRKDIARILTALTHKATTK